MNGAWDNQTQQNQGEYASGLLDHHQRLLRRPSPGMQHQVPSQSAPDFSFQAPFPGGAQQPPFNYTQRSPPAASSNQQFSNTQFYQLPTATDQAHLQQQQQQQQSQFQGELYGVSGAGLALPQHQHPSYSGLPAQTHNDQLFDNGTGPIPFRPTVAPYPTVAMHIQSSQGQSQYIVPGNAGDIAAKRMRDDDGDPDESQQEIPRKATGACARCKSLKVRCEFKTNPDICRRCLNGNHECVIPGRKKRRAPPKRELLLKEIQRQAEEIKSLMAQLEQANHRKGSGGDAIASAPSPSYSTNTSTDFFSSSSAPSDFATTDTESGGVQSPPVTEQVAKPDVLDWIAKARESLNEFDGYINASTGGAFDDDDNESVIADEFVEIDVEDIDGDETGTLMDENEEYDVGHSGDESHSVGGRPGQHHRTSSHDAAAAAAAKKGTLAALSTSAAPFGLMQRLSLGIPRPRRPSRSASENGDEEQDAAEQSAYYDYFRPATRPDRPIVDKQTEPPQILRKGVVTPTEVEKLFKIYFDYMNTSINILDPELYTPQKTYWRSPFLFTVICAIASRFYEPRPELYAQAMHFARQAAGSALIAGRKNIEMVQAYVNLALHPVPCRRWEDDRSWVYLGLAIRIATAINLHHPSTLKPKNEQHARELNNRTRTWLTCFNIDRSFATQYGKPPIIPMTDYIANHASEWWNSSSANIPNYDIHIAAYTAELGVVSDFGAKIRNDKNDPTGFNKSLDIPALAAEADDELSRFWETWTGLLQKHTDLSDPQANFRKGLLKIACNYGRLSALSFGFQHSFTKKTGGDPGLLWRCLKRAKEVALTYVDDIGVPQQRILLRHGPEAHSVFVTFACTFLIKLLHPKYANYLPFDERAKIRELVGRVADLLGSPEVAVDDRHYPKLYSRFLKGLLDSALAKNDPPSNPPSNRQSKSESPLARHGDLPEASHTSRSSASTPSSARPSASPPPTQMSSQHGALFDQGVAGATGGMDPYATNMFTDSYPSMNIPEFFQPPLPFGEEMLGTVQSLTDPALFQNAMTGFAWMGDFHNNDHDMTGQYDTTMY
ncbi:hypothetical protein K474DRAFT_194545 [Panus rudis PR-1116 ss-1]|nr:hypothetical protein K474DRAFT_194545 [Panus rudis PR-1116 ss-1]